jgi:hypothetical protein
MPRYSVETAKTVLASLISEQERDRENLQRMLDHSEKMVEHLAKLRDEEEQRIDEETLERKTQLRRLFAQLITVEEERKQRLGLHIADIDGLQSLTSQPNPPVNLGANAKLAVVGKTN